MASISKDTHGENRAAIHVNKSERVFPTSDDKLKHHALTDSVTFTGSKFEPEAELDSL